MKSRAWDDERVLLTSVESVHLHEFHINTICSFSIYYLVIRKHTHMNMCIFVVYCACDNSMSHRHTILLRRACYMRWMRSYGKFPNTNKRNKKWNEKLKFTFELCCVPISILVHANDHFKGLPRMEALIRIANIPIVESGVKTAGKVYLNLKVCCYAFKILIENNKETHNTICHHGHVKMLKITITTTISMLFFSNVMDCFHGASIQPKEYFLQLLKQFSQQLKLLKDHCSVSIKFYAIAWILLSNVSHPFIYHHKWFVSNIVLNFILVSFSHFLFFFCTFSDCKFCTNNNNNKRLKRKEKNEWREEKTLLITKYFTHLIF